MVTIPVSSVPLVQDYLVAAITAQLSTADQATVVVCVGQEPTLDEPVDVIRTSTVRRENEVTTFIGSGAQFWLNEEYELDIVVSCWDGDGSNPQTQVDARAWQLVGIVETAIRADPSLGKLVDMGFPSRVEGGEAVWTADPVGRLCEITVVLKVSHLN